MYSEPSQTHFSSWMEEFISTERIITAADVSKDWFSVFINHLVNVSKAWYFMCIICWQTLLMDNQASFCLVIQPPN